MPLGGRFALPGADNGRALSGSTVRAFTGSSHHASAVITEAGDSNIVANAKALDNYPAKSWPPPDTDQFEHM